MSTLTPVTTSSTTVNFAAGAIDAHAHLHLRPGAAEKLLARMDQLGIARTVVVAGGTVTPEVLSRHFTQGGSEDVEVDNDAIFAVCAGTGGRLLPFFFANPVRGAAAYRRGGQRFYGLKLAPIVHGIPYSDPRMAELIDVAETFGHPVYAHCLPREGFWVKDFAALAARKPNVRMILGHGGVGHGDFAGIAQVAPLPNVYFEMSGTFTHATRVAVEKLGAHRVLFGSEFPLQDAAVELAKLDCLDLSPEDRQRILRGNIEGLLS